MHCEVSFPLSLNNELSGAESFIVTPHQKPEKTIFAETQRRTCHLSVHHRPSTSSKIPQPPTGRERLADESNALQVDCVIPLGGSSRGSGSAIETVSPCLAERSDYRSIHDRTRATPRGQPYSPDAEFPGVHMERKVIPLAARECVQPRQHQSCVLHSPVRHVLVRSE